MEGKNFDGMQRSSGGEVCEINKKKWREKKAPRKNDVSGQTKLK